MATKLQNFLKLLKNTYETLPNKDGGFDMNKECIKFYLDKNTIEMSMVNRCSNSSGLIRLKNQSRKIHQLNSSLTTPFKFIETFNVWQSGDYNEDFCDMLLSLTPTKNIKEYNLYIAIYKATLNLGEFLYFNINYENDDKTITSINIKFIDNYEDFDNAEVKKIVDETIDIILLNIKKFYTKKSHQVSLYQYNKEYGWNWNLNISFKDIV